MLQTGQLNEDIVASLANEVGFTDPNPSVTLEYTEAATLMSDPNLTLRVSDDFPRLKLPPSSLPVKDWDRYKFVGFIGEGGMGRVYKAHDPQLNRNVALKFILGNSPEMAKRLDRKSVV